MWLKQRAVDKEKRGEVKIRKLLYFPDVLIF